MADFEMYRNMERLGYSVCIIDLNGIIQYVSPWVAELEDTKASKMIGKHVTVALNITQDDTLMLHAMHNKCIIKNVVKEYCSYAGKKTYEVYDAAPIIIDKKVTGAFCICRSYQDVETTVQCLHDFKSQRQELPKSAPAKQGGYIFSDIICESLVMYDLIDKAKRAAASRSPIMITGETGTGKELFAHSIHNYLTVQAGPFVSINCSAIPETLIESTLFGTSKGAYTGAINSPGLFEEANHGTLFLDELNSMSLSTQAKLLRVLQDHNIRRVGSTKEIHIDCRIISAINLDATECIAQGQLRTDLFYRLSAVFIDIPPLRLRRDDILPLAYFFINQYNTILGRHINSIKSDITLAFKEYSWPGNVRELQHIIEHALNMADENEATLQRKHLPSYFTKTVFSTTFLPIESNILSSYKKEKAMALNVFEEEFASKYIVNAWNQSGGRLGKTATLLGLSRQQLYNLIKKYDIALD